MVTKTGIKTVCLFSGGIDSLASLVWSIETYGKENVIPLFVNMQHKYYQEEERSAFQLCEMLGLKLKIAYTPWVGLKEKEDAHIPYRNLSLITTALYYLPENEGGNVVIQNVQVGETSIGDRTEEFNNKLQNLLNFIETDRLINIKTPFKDNTKGQIVRYLLQRGINEDYLIKTVGCFNEGLLHCGECGACFRRYVALKGAGIECDNWFQIHPTKQTENSKKYLDKMLAGEYDDRRMIETLNVLIDDGLLKGVYAVDMDDTLCYSTPWWLYSQAEPIQEHIDEVNRLYDQGYGIFIHTSRFESDREVTEQWLKEHGVKYHRLVTQKIFATHYWDDRACKNSKRVCEDKQ